uniref:Ig-like domain-containing protein n=1 Tax=Ditylenchus dipsaci TaxID=166011 RepID=A0A915DL89_9BILA
MRRLAENFIFRKIKRLRKTESGRSISEEEEWREEVHLIRDDDSAEQPAYPHYPHYFSNTSSSLSSKTPPKVPPKPASSTTSDPWASLYDGEFGSDGTGSTILHRPTRQPEENVTESFAIHSSYSETSQKIFNWLWRTPTNSISERIANEEVADVLKDCNSMVGVDPINDFSAIVTPIKPEATSQAKGSAFTYHIHSNTSLVHRAHQRPPSAPPYLVQTNSYCHSAKVIEITQEWRLGRESEVGQARGVFVPWEAGAQTMSNHGFSSLPPKSPSSMLASRPSLQPSKGRSSPLPPLNRPTPPLRLFKTGSITPQTNGHLTLPSARPKEPLQLHKTRSEHPANPFTYIDSQQYSSLKQTIKQVEQDLDSAQALTLESRANEARLIEQAIWAISERLSPHPNVTWTKAQAAANEELLRTRLAEMILNLNDTPVSFNSKLPATNQVSKQQEQVSNYHYGLLKEPIEILRQKLNCLEQFVEEEDSIQEELTTLKHLPTPDRHTPTNQMTPLIVVVKGKLTDLEDITQEEGKAAAKSGRSTPYEERRTIYDLLTKINEEINTIHELCRSEEPSKVCFHLDAILETLRGQEKKTNGLQNGLGSSKRPFNRTESQPPSNGMTSSSTSKELDAESSATISTMQESVNSFVFGRQAPKPLLQASNKPSQSNQLPKKPLPRRLLEEEALSNHFKPPPSPTYGHRLLPEPVPSLPQTPKSRQHQPTAGHSLAQVEVSVQLNRRAEHQLAKGSLPIGVLNMQMSQYIFHEEEEDKEDQVSMDRSVQMVCEESDDTTTTNNTSSQLKGTVNTFHTPPQTHIDLTGLIHSAEHSPLPFSQIGYNFSVDQKGASKSATHPRKDSGIPVDPSPALINPQQRSVTPLQAPGPILVHLKVPQEDEEEGTSSCLSLSENVPILFRKVSDLSGRKETAILTDEEGEQPSTSLSTMHVYNLKTSCTETFDLRRRRRHALLNAVVFPEARAQITATFLGDSFQIDIERMSETGRESVVMVSEEFYSKKMKITRKSPTSSPILERRSNSKSDDESVFVDTLAKLNVSIMARSAKDDVHVHLEEIPWGQVDLETTVSPPTQQHQQPMERSFNSEAGGASLLFNIHVAENQDEARSLASHRLEAGSETKSLAGLSERTNLSLSHSQEDLDIATYVIKQGSTASITCELNNYVDKTRPIEWYRNGKERVGPLGNGQPSKFERISHDLLEVLVIQNVQVEDGQLYSIKVNGEMYPVAYLIIEEGDESQSTPKFLSKTPQTMFVMQGQTAIMSCQMNKSRLDVVWYKETEQLVPGNDDRVFFESTGNGWYRVIVEDVDFGDQGTYFACWEQNSICITLLVEEKIDEREVQVTCELDTTSEQLADQPSPHLHWQRNNRDLNTSEAGSGKFEHVISNNKHYLIIHNAQPKDSGVYSVRINETRFKVAQITISDGLLNRQLSGSRIKRISNNSLNMA